VFTVRHAKSSDFTTLRQRQVNERENKNILGDTHYLLVPVPPQNPVDRKIADVSTLEVKRIRALAHNVHWY
jgi:hypothetical protein